MLLPGQTKLSAFSIEEYERYGLLDDVGCIVGVKDDAPAEFKEAYEADKKFYQKMEAEGLD